MSLFGALSSFLPSGSPPPPPSAPTQDKKLTTEVQVEEPRQPRKSKTVKPNDKEQPQSDDDQNKFVSRGVSGVSAQIESSRTVSLAMKQETDRVQGFEQPMLSEDRESDQALVSTPETIHYNLASDADSETVDSEIKETRHTANSITTTTTTTTKVEGRKRTDVQSPDQSISESAATQKRYEVRSSTQGGVQRKVSFYQETSLAPVTQAGQPPSFSSISTIVDTRRAVVHSGTMYNSVQEELKRLKSLYIQQTECTESILTTQHKEYERYCEEGFAALQTENETLRQRIAMLEVQLSSVRGHQTTLSLPDNTESTITTITTNIITITTTITTVTTRIDLWKRTMGKNGGKVSISSKELEQLSLDLSSASSQLSELQQRYTEQSGEIIAVRNELQATLSLRDQNARTLASLTAEVAHLKQADATKVDAQIRELVSSIEEKDSRIASITAQLAQSQRTDTLRAEQIAASTSRINELQQRYDAQLRELASVRNELQGKVSLIEEKNRTVASITAELTQWKQSDSVKTEQIATARENNERLQRDLSAATAQIADLQKRYNTQSGDLGTLRNELQAKGSLLDEKERTFTTLTVELDQRKRADATTADQFAAARRDNEKLQRDLAAFSSQTADLQKRYDEQSRDLVSVRTELHTKVSLLDEKDHTINSFTTQVAQWKREDTVKAGQIESARRDVEQLRRDLSAASSRTADLQKRYEAQSKELNSVRDELHQIEILYSEGKDQAPGEPSEHAVTQHIAMALEKKNKHMEELRRDLAVATSRNAELQKQYEAVSREISTIRDELKVKASQNEGTVASLTAQVDQWKRADSKKAEQIATTLEQVEKLQQDLSTSTSQFSELQTRYEAQSRDLITMCNELQAGTTSHEGKDRTIASLTAEVDQWKRADVNKAEEIATMNKTIETLQRNISTSASQLAELKGRSEAQSRDLTALRDELQAKTASHDSKDRTIASLTAEVGQWKHADTAKGEQIAATLKQIEKLQRDVSVSSSRIAELQDRYDAQSHELVFVRNELQTKTSLQEGRDRTIASLTAEVELWKREDAMKAEQIETTVKQVEKFTSQITELHDRYNLQTRELTSVRNELQTQTSLLQEGRDRTVAALTTQVEEWKRADALKAEQIVATRKQLEKLQLELTNCSSQLAELLQRYETQSREHTSLRDQLEADLSAKGRIVVSLTSEVEEWKRSDAVKSGELATVRMDLESLRRDLATSSSQIIDFQLRYDAQSTELSALRSQKLALEEGKDRTVVTLTSEVERWKREDTSKAEELAAARKNVEQLQRDLAAASLRLASSQNPLPTPSLSVEESSSISQESKAIYEKITTQYEMRDHAALLKLTTTVDEWLYSDVRRSEQIALELEKRKNENEELRQKLVTLKEIYVRAPELKQIFQSQTIEIQRRYEEQSRQLKSALAERQSQLDGVQRFITTADTYADTAIIQMLQKLNAEVQQSTTFMAECVVEDFRPQGATTKLTKEQSAAMQRVSQSIGQTLLGCLVRKEVEEVALYLPIAFQAYLSYHLRWIVSSWTIENGRNDVIDQIYQRLQKSEAQAISGRWRSLTRNYILPTSTSDPSPLISSTIAGLSDIVMVAGCAASQSAAKTKLSSKFESKISSIISIAGRFSKMIGEVVSGDFEVFAVRPGETFEEGTMEEDTDDEDKVHAKPGGTGMGQKVLCSTQLGMTKRIQLEEGKKETLAVIKGKVVLESFLVD